MRVDRLLYPVTTLGPGSRVAIWTAGCTKCCAGCANPELWQDRPSQEVPCESLASMLLHLAEDNGAHRLTFTGGDPLEQAGEVVGLLRAVRDAYDDVLVYTGYTLAEARACLKDTWEELVSLVDVIVDGRYVWEQNDGCALRGSSNQVVHVLTSALRDDYDACLRQGRSVQNFVCGRGVISVGIHDREEDDAE